MHLIEMKKKAKNGDACRKAQHLEGRERQEDQEFNVILSYIVNSRLACLYDIVSGHTHTHTHTETDTHNNDEIK